MLVKFKTRATIAAICRRITYAKTVATLALFLALGGASWAAVSLPADSVGTKQITDAAVTLVKISPGARRVLHGATGRRGPTGRAGADAVKYFAYVSANGTVRRGSSGVTSMYDSGGINYAVTFPISVASCVADVTPGNSPVQGGGSSPTAVLVSAAIGQEYNAQTPNTVVRVTFSNPAGGPALASFYLAVLC